MRKTYRSIAVALLSASSLLLPIDGAQASKHFAFFDPDNYGLAESNSTITITVKRDGSATTQTGTGTIRWETVDGTAQASAGDYVAASGTITFQPANGLQTFTVQVKDDSAFEGNETFQIRFVDGSYGGPGNDIKDHGGPATVTIKDNDPSPPSPPSPSPSPSPTPTPRATQTKASPAPSPSPSPSPTATPQAAATSPSPSPTETTTPEVAITQEDDGAPLGLIVGIGALVLAAGAGVGLWFLRRTPA